MSQPKASSLEVQFNRGLRQDLEENLLPPGALVTADNVEFDKLGRLQKREGFTSLSTDSLNTSADPVVIPFVGPAKRFAEGALGEQLAFTDENAHLYFPDEDKMRVAGQAYNAGGQISAMRGTLTGRFNVGGDQAGQFVCCDSCGVGDWIVVAYVQLRPDGTAYDLKVDVLDKRTRARAISGFPAATGIGPVPAISGTLQMVRVVESAFTSGIAVVVWCTGANISYMSINLSGPTIPNPTAGGTVLFADADPTLPVFDVAPTLTGFLVAYRYKAAPTHNWVRACVFDSNGMPATAVIDLQSDQNSGSPKPFDATAISVLGARTVSDAVFVICASAGDATYPTTGDQFEMFFPDYNLSLPVIYDIKSYLVVDGYTGGDTQQSTISRVGATEAAFLWSGGVVSLTQSGVANGPRGPIFIATLIPGNIGGAYLAVGPAFANYVLGSRLYTDSTGNQYAWGRFNIQDQAQSHYLLLDFCGNGDQSFRRPTPVLHVANGLVQTFGVSGGVANGPIPLPSMADLGDNEWLFAAPVNLGGSIILGQQVGCWTGEALGQKRFLSVLGRKTLLVGGGTPLSYDGQRLVELSFYSYPEASDPVLNVGSGLLSAGDYQYRFVYEWTDAAGMRHQSPASPATAPITAAALDAFDLQVSTIHATRKQVIQNAGLAFAPYDDNAPVRVVAYRTTATGPTYYRCSTAMVNKIATTPGGPNLSSSVTMTDGESDASIALNEILYATDGGQGKLSSNCPPPTTLMVVHAGRLWGLDGENPERIWCTKTFEEGEAPGYNPGLQVLIPGCGALNGIGGQDDKLYGFATEGTYIASFGPGPDNTGQGGGFPDPVLITSSALCDDPRGVITSQNGIYFTGPDHWGTTVFLLRRGDGAPVNIGERVRDELHDESSGTPVIRGVIERKDKARVEFLFVDADESPSQGKILNYHYDLVDESNVGQWTATKFYGQDGYPLECIGLWDGLTVIGGVALYPALALLRQEGLTEVGGSEVPGIDALNSFEYDVVTGDLRPFGIAGYGDVHSLTLAGTGRTRAGFIEISASYDSRITFPDSVGTNTREVDGNPVMRRWEPATKKLPFGSVSYRFHERLTTEGGAIYTDEAILHGFTLECVALGGNVRLPANCRENEEPLVVPVGTSAVTKTGAGTSMTVTGTPTAFGHGIVTLLGPTGPSGTGTFSWSYLGQSQTGISTSNLNYALGTTGVTIHFVAGGFVMGTKYEWDGV